MVGLKKATFSNTFLVLEIATPCTSFDAAARPIQVKRIELLPLSTFDVTIGAKDLGFDWVVTLPVNPGVPCSATLERFSAAAEHNRLDLKRSISIRRKYAVSAKNLFPENPASLRAKPLINNSFKRIYYITGGPSDLMRKPDHSLWTLVTSLAILLLQVSNYRPLKNERGSIVENSAAKRVVPTDARVETLEESPFGFIFADREIPHSSHVTVSLEHEPQKPVDMLN
jgi:hypothetical protein